MLKTFVRSGAAVAFAGLLAAGAGYAQTYPARAITAVVPVSAGSAIDVASRAVLAEVSRRLGQPIVVDNKAGASGNIGAAHVASATPDGYTVLITSSNVTMAPALMARVPWNPETAFAPVAAMFTGAMGLAVGAHVPAQNVQELVALARKQPTMLTYATPGNGTPHHFGSFLFSRTAGIELTHVPYKGLGNAVIDLVGGRVDMAYFSMGNLLEHHKANRLRILAVGTPERMPQTPQVPTLRELGMQDAEVNVWIGMLAPAGTPGAIVTRLQNEVQEALKTPAVKAVLDAQFFVPLKPATAEHLAAQYKEDLVRWPQVVKSIGLKVE